MRFSLTAVSWGLARGGIDGYIELSVCVCVHGFQLLWPPPHPYGLRFSPHDGYRRTSTLISVHSEKTPVSSCRGATGNGQAQFHERQCATLFCSFFISPHFTWNLVFVFLLETKSSVHLLLLSFILYYIKAVLTLQPLIQALIDPLPCIMITNND